MKQMHSKSWLVPLAALAAGVAFAQGPATAPDAKDAAKTPHRPPMMRRMPGPYGSMAGMPVNDPLVRFVSAPNTAERLGLSEEQQAKIVALQKDVSEKMRTVRESMRTANEKQAELLRAETIDEAAVMAAIEQVWKLRCDMAKLQTKKLIGVKQILTPEQVAKALATIKENAAKRRPPRRSLPNAGKGDATPPPPPPAAKKDDAEPPPPPPADAKKDEAKTPAK